MTPWRRENRGHHGRGEHGGQGRLKKKDIQIGLPLQARIPYLRLQHLQRARQVQQALGARANHAHRRPPQLHQVRGNIEALLAATVHAAEAASDEDAHAGEVRQQHGGAHGGGTVRALG